MLKLPRVILLSLAIVLLHLLLMGLARVLFWLTFDEPSNPLPFVELLRALYIGGKFDLRLTLILLLPVLLLGGWSWFGLVRSRAHRIFWQTWLTLLFAGLMLFHIFDFGYYAYLQKPMDATILRFTVDADISLAMLWQSYPVIRLLLLLLAICAGYFLLLRWLLLRIARLPTPRYNYKQTTALVALSSVLVLGGIYGKFSYYPLRWSDAFTSVHTFAPAVTLNPVLYFFDTLKNRETGYDLDATRHYYPLLAEFLGVEQPDPEQLNFSRQIREPGPLAAQRPNIVVVLLESFAAYKTGNFGNPLNPTPHFSALAEQGLLFTRFYTPHTGTARSVFTALTALPDVELNRTSSRNPLVVDQRTLVNAFEGYETLYFLGGSANWGNIRGLISHNIPGLKIFEEGYYQAPRVDVWGVSDLHLLEEANWVLRELDKPFFAFIQTAGNHRPYTIPEDSRGFRLEQHDDETLRNSGFISNAEFNSFRYMDHSIGHFMQQARQEAYFDNTIFVFFGDHGITGYTGRHRPEYETHFDLAGLHVPLLIYAPKLIAPRVDERIASEVDVLPTLAALAAAPHQLTTLGRNLLDPRFDTRRYAFTIAHHSVPEIGLISDTHIFRMRADGSQRGLFPRGPDFAQDISAQEPELAEFLEQLCLGIHETARYLRFHNPNPQLQATTP